MTEPIESRDFFPELRRNVTPTSTGSTVVSYTSDLGPSKPIVTLIHGYPQSAFEWRYIVPHLWHKVSLYIPELPGYGISSPSNDNTRLGIATTLMDSLAQVFQADASSPRRVIAIGHDRGARIVHRLTVSRSNFPSITMIGCGMFDIVPTKAQWDAFSDPLVSSGYFHWPLLANVEPATAMIKAYGGARWVETLHERITGGPEGMARAAADDAIVVYGTLFEKEETIRYSCEDYAYGSTPEYKHQAEDQEAGRKVNVPTLVMFSKAKLGQRMDVAKIWQDWVADGVELQIIGVGDGHGHFLPEEASQEVADAINLFVIQLMRASL